MNCPKCSNEMVKAQATNFGEQYDYCRTCKKELKELRAAELPYAAPVSWDHDTHMRLAKQAARRVMVVRPSAPWDTCDSPNPAAMQERHVADPGSGAHCYCGALEMDPNGGWQFRQATPAPTVAPKNGLRFSAGPPSPYGPYGVIKSEYFNDNFVNADFKKRIAELYAEVYRNMAMFGECKIFVKADES